jgi:hypothetical protein
MQEQEAVSRLVSVHTALMPQGDGLHGCLISTGRMVPGKKGGEKLAAKHSKVVSRLSVDKK